jgi:energy-coupling factor transporter ATP-binding protein EcfA2
MNFATFKRIFPFTFWLFSCLAIFIFFRQPIDQLLDNVLVKPIFEQFANTKLTGFVLIVFSFGIAMSLCLYGEKKVLRLLALYALSGYILLLTDEYWELQYSSLLPSVRNWEFLLLALIIPALTTFFNSKHSQALEQSNNGFTEDLAIEDESQDSFKRGLIAQEIAKKISITANKRSFAIGILGEYGSGKTSFINLIKVHLDHETTAVVNFNPWSADNATNIQSDFFDLLASKLYELNPKISSLIIDYSRKLSRTDASFHKYVTNIKLAGNLFTKTNHSDDFEKINCLLAQSGKKIIVTIDDLDRLYNNEVMEVLRLIRNTASFTNIFYLVAYERGFVDDAIKSLNPSASSSFLDKIIQLEIPLPKRESNDLLEMLESKLKEFIQADDLESFKSHIIKTGFRFKHYFSFERVFRQSRDVIKFINNFKLTYELIGDEVEFDSLFVLELLKFRFPLIYDRLYEHRDDFVSARPSRSTHDEIYELRTYKEDKEDKLLIAKTLQEEGRYLPGDVDLISGLINNLFFKFDRSLNAKNSILYPMFFERYFRYRLSGKDISEKRFQEALKSKQDGLKAYIDECAEKGLLNELSDRIFQFKATSRENYELKLQSLFYLGPKYIRDKAASSFDFQALTDLMWNYDQNVEKRYYKKDPGGFEAFLLKLFNQAMFPFMFESEVIYHISSGSKAIPLSKETLGNYQAHYFSEHVSSSGITKAAVWIFWWTKVKTFVPLPNDPNRGIEHWHFKKEIVPITKRLLPLYDPFQFLKISIKSDMRNNDIFFLYSEILELFDDPEELRTIVAGHNIMEEKYKTDYLGFFDACKEKDFKDWATFEFKTDLRPKRSDYDEY